MDALSFRVSHPAYQQLRQQGRWLHLMAAGLILVHAFSHLRQQDPSLVYLSCLFLLALDLLVLVLASRTLLIDQPRLNLFFRLTEVIFFGIIATEYFLKRGWIAGGVHSISAIAYAWLWYCERQLAREELVKILHSGIEIPGIPDEKFFIWSKINQLNISYSTLDISTSDNENHTLEFIENLKPDELEQLQAFRKYYLKSE